MIKTENICLSILKAIAQKLKFNTNKIVNNSPSTTNVLIMSGVSRCYTETDLVHAILSVLNSYQKHLLIDTQCTVNCKSYDVAVGLGVNTQSYSYVTHVGGMLYDELYAKNQHDGFCLVIDVHHTVTDICDGIGSLLISVSANKVMDV